MTTRERRSPRVTIKVRRATFNTLAKIRHDTGTPISVLLDKAVDSYASWMPRRKPGRPRKLRGSR